MLIEAMQTGIIEKTPEGEVYMSEKNKALIRRFHDEVINKGNLELIDDLCAPSLVDHAAPQGSPSGTEGVKQMISMFRAAFPDVNSTVEDLIAEGDKVVARFTFRGTHKGEFMGIAPTGVQIEVTGIEINRIVAGKCVEHWENFDMLGMMQQLGVVPRPG